MSNKEVIEALQNQNGVLTRIESRLEDIANLLSLSLCDQLDRFSSEETPADEKDQGKTDHPLVFKNEIAGVVDLSAGVSRAELSAMKEKFQSLKKALNAFEIVISHHELENAAKVKSLMEGSESNSDGYSISQSLMGVKQSKKTEVPKLSLLETASLLKRVGPALKDIIIETEFKSPANYQKLSKLLNDHGILSQKNATHRYDALRKIIRRGIAKGEINKDEFVTLFLSRPKGKPPASIFLSPTTFQEICGYLQKTGKLPLEES